MKLTLWIDDSSGQIVRSLSEPWSDSDDGKSATVPSPPSLVLNEEQKRLFSKAKEKQKAASPHPVWTKLKRGEM